MQDINEAVLLALYEGQNGSTEVKLLAKILLENCIELSQLRDKVARYEKVLIERRSIPLTQDEIEEIQKLRLIYNKALPKDYDHGTNNS